MSGRSRSRRQRGIFATAPRVRADVVEFRVPRLPTRTVSVRRMQEVQDDRLYTPDVHRAERSVGGRRIPRGLSDTAAFNRFRPVLRFDEPQRVIRCVRRKRRRSVLFAMRKTGKGSASVFRRRTIWSSVAC